MAWTTPRTWVAGETVTDTLMNTHVRDNLAYLGTGIIRLNVNTTAVGNVGAGEDDLITYSLPAATLGVDGMGVRVTAAGSFAANANNKLVKMYFGSTSLTTWATAPYNNVKWRYVAEIIRTGAGAQIASSQFVSTGGSGGHTTFPDHVRVGTTTPAETLSGAVTIKCTGEATSNDDIQQLLLLVELIR